MPQSINKNSAFASPGNPIGLATGMIAATLIALHKHPQNTWQTVLIEYAPAYFFAAFLIAIWFYCRFGKSTAKQQQSSPKPNNP